MLSKKVQDAFNKHMNEEFFSSYLYLGMAAHLESKNMSGMAHWMKLQAEEEREHAMKFYAYILERGGDVKLQDIAAPKGTWKNPIEVFEEAYKHECHISALINKLVDLAVKEKDHAANIFLQWFVTEQVEEEASALDVVEKLKMVGDSDMALFMMDGRLAQRQ